MLRLTHSAATPAKTERSPEPATGMSNAPIVHTATPLMTTLPEKEHAPQVKKRRIVDSDDESDISGGDVRFA